MLYYNSSDDERDSHDLTSFLFEARVDLVKKKIDELKTLGNRLQRSRRPTSAIEQYRKGLELADAEEWRDRGEVKGIRSILHSNIAASLLLLKRYEEALTEACAAITADRKYLKGHARKVRALCELNRPHEALEASQNAIHVIARPPLFRSTEKEKAEAELKLLLLEEQRPELRYFRKAKEESEEAIRVLIQSQLAQESIVVSRPDIAACCGLGTAYLGKGTLTSRLSQFEQEVALLIPEENFWFEDALWCSLQEESPGLQRFVKERNLVETGELDVVAMKYASRGRPPQLINRFGVGEEEGEEQEEEQEDEEVVVVEGNDTGSPPAISNVEKIYGFHVLLKAFKEDCAHKTQLQDAKKCRKEWRSLVRRPDLDPEWSLFHRILLGCPLSEIWAIFKRLFPVISRHVVEVSTHDDCLPLFREIFYLDVFRKIEKKSLLSIGPTMDGLVCVVCGVSVPFHVLVHILEFYKIRTRFYPKSWIPSPLTMNSTWHLAFKSSYRKLNSYSYNHLRKFPPYLALQSVRNLEIQGDAWGNHGAPRILHLAQSINWALLEELEVSRKLFGKILGDYFQEHDIVLGRCKRVNPLTTLPVSIHSRLPALEETSCNSPNHQVYAAALAVFPNLRFLSTLLDLGRCNQPGVVKKKLGRFSSLAGTQIDVSLELVYFHTSDDQFAECFRFFSHSDGNDFSRFKLSFSRDQSYGDPSCYRNDVHCEANKLVGGILDCMMRVRSLVKDLQLKSILSNCSLIRKPILLQSACDWALSTLVWNLPTTPILMTTPTGIIAPTPGSSDPPLTPTPTPTPSPTPTPVMLKRLKLHTTPDDEEDGFPVSFIREISILMMLGSHNRIVQLQEVVVGSTMDVVYLVFEKLPRSLKEELRGRRMWNWNSRKGKSRSSNVSASMASPSSSEKQIMCRLLDVGDIRKYMRGLLEGVAFLHSMGILHRDVKPANVLIGDSADIVKLADFGLARRFRCLEGDLLPSAHTLTPNIVTLWWRPPELFLGETEYGTEIDMWSVGVILFQLLVGHVPFLATREIDITIQILDMLGPAPVGGRIEFLLARSHIRPVGEENFDPSSGPSEKLQKLRAGILKLLEREGCLFRGQIDPCALDLCARLMCLEPSERLTADEALLHSFFAEPDTDVVMETETESEGEGEQAMSRKRRREPGTSNSEPHPKRMKLSPSEDQAD